MSGHVPVAPWKDRLRFPVAAAEEREPRVPSTKGEPHVNTGKDRRLPGKQRRNAQKAARR